MAQRILRRAEVLHRCGLSRSSLYAFMAQGTFPNSVKISVRAVGWFESEIDDWLKARTKQSTNAIRVTNKDGGRS